MRFEEALETAGVHLVAVRERVRAVVGDDPILPEFLDCTQRFLQWVFTKTEGDLLREYLDVWRSYLAKLNDWTDVFEAFELE